MKTVDLAFSKLEEVLKETGQVIDAKGGDLTVEQYFQMIEQIAMSFDPRGRPVWPEAAGGQAPRLREMERLVFSTPDLLVRLKEIVRKKRENWNAREADRTLVG